MNLYLSTLTFIGEAESADDFGEQLLEALAGNEDARKVIHSTGTPLVHKIGRFEKDETE